MFINLSCCCCPIPLGHVRRYHKCKSRTTTSLDGAGSNHLLLQVLLVRADAAVPAGDGLVLAHHDVLGDLVEESGSEYVSNFLLKRVAEGEVKTYLKS